MNNSIQSNPSQQKPHLRHTPIPIQQDLSTAQLPKASQSHSNTSTSDTSINNRSVAQSNINNTPTDPAKSLTVSNILLDTTTTIPPYVTTLTTGNIEGTLLFASDSQCSSLTTGIIINYVTIPTSVVTLKTGLIYGSLQFAPDSQCTSLTTGNIYGTLQFAPDSQCTSLTTGYIAKNATLNVPASVTSLTTGYIYGTLQFAPDSQCTSISIITADNIIHSVTIPASVTTLKTYNFNGTLLLTPDSQCTSLTIDDETFTGQSLLDLKSGKTSHPNVSFK